MSVQSDEMVSPEAYRAVCEERDRLRARSPRTKIEGVECKCDPNPGGNTLCVAEFETDVRPWGLRVHATTQHEVGLMWGGFAGDMSADQAEVLASKLHWCARVARGEDVSDYDRPRLVPVEERDELATRVHDLERDLAGAVELTRRQRERADTLRRHHRAAVDELLSDGRGMGEVIIRQLLELSRRGVVPSEVTVRELRRLEAVGLVEWRDGAYWRTEVSCG